MTETHNIRRTRSLIAGIAVLLLGLGLFGLVRLALGAYGELESDAIGCWHLNDNDSTETDSCGSNNMSMSGETYTSNGYLGGAYQFTDDEASTGYQPDGSDVSVTMWIKINDKTGTYTVMFGCNDGSNHRLYFGLFSAGNVIFLGWGTGYKNSTAYSWSTGKWYYLVFTVASDSVTFYINGAAEDSLTGTTFSGTSSDTAKVGGFGVYRIVDAIIDEVVIYDRALSAAEIKQLYAMQKGSYGVN
jgi:hypothetical protein